LHELIYQQHYTIRYKKWLGENANLTLARPGSHNDPPIKNLCDSFVIDLFHTPFPEKKDEWMKKLFQLKKNEKKI